MTYRMDIEEIVPKVFYVKMTNSRILAKTFMRFQEYYESPYENINKKIFTREEYKETYKEKMNSNKFTYETDWTGFNIPSRVFKPFIQGKFDPLLKCEQKLVDTFKDCNYKRFYVIGTRANDACGLTLKHEISHGLWYTNPRYKKEQLKNLSHVCNIGSIRKIISDQGYCDAVLDDESHAYLITHPAPLGRENIRVNEVPIKNLTKTFNKYSPIKL